jgi:hypothetical protein
MRRTFVSFSKFWTKASKAVGDILESIYAPGVSYLLAALAVALTPQTVIGVGVLYPSYWYLILAGIVLLAGWASSPTPGTAVPLWGAALLMGVPLMPTPSLKLGLLGIGLSSILARWKHPYAQRYAWGMLQVSSAWLLTLFLQNAYAYFEARLETFPLVAKSLSLMLSAIGYPAHSDGSTVYLAKDGEIVSVFISGDKFGGAFPLLFVANLTLLHIFRPYDLRSLLSVFILTIFYTLMRAGWLIGQVTETGEYAWWDGTAVLRSYLPLVGLVAIALRPLSITKESPRSDAPQRKPHVVGTVLTVVGTAGLVVGWLWVDPGVKKQGAILIDEHYSRWEWSEMPLDTEYYGVKTVYSYYCMVEALKHYYPQVRRNFQEITDETLRDVSVLILKTPTKPYSETAIQAIRRFIERGGGVWLIGDHTNIFGMNTYLNMIGEPLGIRFREDSAIPPMMGRQLFEPNRLSHPIVRHLPLFLFYTGCTLDAPLGTNDVLISQQLLWDKPDYSVNTFFGDFKPSLNERVGAAVQAVALEYGSGRVAAWSDSTLFSNFAIFLPGKMELALMFVEWLNRQNSTPPVRHILLMVSAVLLAVGLYRIRLTLIGYTLWLGVAVGVIAIQYTYDTFYPLPKPYKPFQEIAFWESPFLEHLPIRAPTDDPTPESYLTAFVAAQRLGMRPFVAWSLEEALRTDVVVAIHLHTDISKDEISRLKHWLLEGGTLIVLDGGGGEISGVEKIAKAVGVRIVPLDATNGTITDQSDEVLGSGIVTGFLEGEGKPLLYLRQGQSSKRVVGMEVPIGKGRLFLSTTVSLFSDSSVGENSAVPSRRQLRILRLMYALYSARDMPAERQ